MSVGPHSPAVMDDDEQAGTGSATEWSRQYDTSTVPSTLRIRVSSQSRNRDLAHSPHLNVHEGSARKRRRWHVAIVIDAPALAALDYGRITVGLDYGSLSIELTSQADCT